MMNVPELGQLSEESGWCCGPSYILWSGVTPDTNLAYHHQHKDQLEAKVNEICMTIYLAFKIHIQPQSIIKHIVMS